MWGVRYIHCERILNWNFGGFLYSRYLFQTPYICQSLHKLWGKMFMLGGKVRFYSFRKRRVGGGSARKYLDSLLFFGSLMFLFGLSGWREMAATCICGNSIGQDIHGSNTSKVLGQIPTIWKKNIPTFSTSKRSQDWCYPNITGTDPTQS